tara:strand:+ start:1273 stop:1533 length:261 start_codon:yes stop_codon:yes gene_type:complete
MEKDWDHIAKVEKAIRQKYGKDAIVNPNSEWSDIKEKEYIEQLKEMSSRHRSIEEQQEKVEVALMLISFDATGAGAYRWAPVGDVS